MNRRAFLTTAAYVSAALAAPVALGQTSTTRVLVGASPGGGTDILARLLAKELGERLGRTFVVENKPGAAGNIAAAEIARSSATGSSVLLAYTSHAINATLYPNLEFDPIADFTPICGVARSPAFLLVSPHLKVKTLNEFLELVREKPGSLNLAIGGLGTASHLAGSILQQRADIDLVPVPYKGATPAMADVAAGHVDATFAAVAGARQQVADGLLIAVGVTSAERLDAFPDVPTIAESFPGYESSAWYGLFGPAGMNPDEVKRLSDATLAILNSAHFREVLNTASMIPMAMDPARFTTYVGEEIQKWGEVIKATGVKPT